MEEKRERGRREGECEEGGGKKRDGWKGVYVCVWRG